MGMKRRAFIKKSSVAAAGAGLVGLSACSSAGEEKKAATDKEVEEVVKKVFTPFELPALPYAYEALEPHIDARTMTIHHDKHHAGYVKKLNAALESHPLAGEDLNAMLAALKDDDADTGVRNNGGGHYNHSLFWKVMSPGGGEAPSGELADAINAHFGSLEKFQEEFSKAAATQFGSGWAWLCVNDKNELFVTSTPNQDNPLMTNLVEHSGRPILGIDVWEHAYYLKYQNKRTEYISAFNQVVNWDVVANNLKQG
jgi:Fe-Mn family superoxide dismutase